MIQEAHRHFIIGRLDHYYDSINNKGNVFLAVSTFITGGLFASMAVLPNYLKSGCSTLIWIIVMLAINILSTLFTLTSLIPYTGSHGKSLIYFGDIANLELPHFLQKFPNQQNTEVVDDLDNQIFYLSKGLKRKFKYLAIAGRLFFLEAIVLLPLLICLIKNLK